MYSLISPQESTETSNEFNTSFYTGRIIVFNPKAKQLP
jgi:hypothetical protein